MPGMRVCLQVRTLRAENRVSETEDLPQDNIYTGGDLLDVSNGL